MALEDVYQRNLHHRTHRAGWLRAAVLGANDGLVSTASLMIGVAAAKADSFLITAGLAGISAGAMSMAVGEYVSVRSQNDIEESDRLLEISHLEIDPDGELLELQQIDIDRELGQFPHTKARPVQAALASAASFTLGGCIPFLGAFAPSLGAKAFSIVIFTIAGLVITGVVSAKMAGSKVLVPTVRVILGGCIGMTITAVIGQIAHISGI